MDFRTSLPFSESPFQINYRQAVLALGSCFAEHIGERLQDRKFELLLNPFGILYNPLSILDSLERLRQGKAIAAEELFQHQELWHHFSFHSRYSQPERDTALEQMNASINQVHQKWDQIDRLILTWGTAYAFRHVAQERIVANCHKLPGETYERFRLNPDQFIPTYRKFLKKEKDQKPDLQVLISVSPVRHLRDGLMENQRSKAVLLLAAEELCRELDFVHYFPAYELVLDDLRDYRFFERDLAHPNATAIDYVWEYFHKACIPTCDQEISRKVEAIIRAAHHRPFHADTAAHKQFCRRQLEKIAQLEAKYSFLNFEKEKAHFQKNN